MKSKIVGQAVVGVALLLVGVICTSCNSVGSDTGPSATAQTPEQKAAAAAKAGESPAKVNNGGGAAPFPQSAKPGEKVGPPGSGSKAGGGQ